MNLDDILSAAIAEGRTVLAEKKKPKVPVAEKRALAAKLLSEQVQRPVVQVHKGIFEITCIVAEYVRRTCKTCNHSELCSVPRVFICEQQVGVPSTRRLHRINNQETVMGHIQRGLPVKTEVYSSPAPFCRHCIKEIIDARRPPEERLDSSRDPAPVFSVSGDLPPLPGVVSSEVPSDFSPREDYSIPYIPDHAGSPVPKEVLPGFNGNGQEADLPAGNS